MTIAVIGAGMAGLACAERLTEGGQTVVVFDKARGPGGRMSTRRAPTPLGEAGFDHGAQYFTVRDGDFRTRAALWIASGTIAPWPAAGADAYVGVPAMSAPIRQMAEGLEVRWASRVERLERDGNAWRVHLDPASGRDDENEALYAAVVVALPAEQAAQLVQGHDEALALAAASTPTAPCWTAMAAFTEPLPIAADVFRGDAIVGWAARNRSKPMRTGPEAWVIQGTPGWSKAQLEDAPEVAARALLNAFSRTAAIEVPAPISLTGHRWRFARSGTFGAPYLRQGTLGLCGDWLLGPRVECAFLSGHALGGALLSLLNR